MTIETKSLTTSQLLHSYVQILVELQTRKIVRTANGPIGDYAEYLVANQLGLTLMKNAQSGHDAEDASGVKFQIKSRRLTLHNHSKQLGAIRNLENHNFDYLIAVLFNDQFEVETVVKIPYEIIRKYARFREHVHAHILVLSDNILNDPSVEDLTSQFR